MIVRTDYGVRTVDATYGIKSAIGTIMICNKKSSLSLVQKSKDCVRGYEGINELLVYIEEGNDAVNEGEENALDDGRQ